MIPEGNVAKITHDNIVVWKKYYDIGDTIWVQGPSNEPTAQTVENGYWVQSVDSDGNRIKKTNCTTPIHEHTPEECWDAVYGLVCTKEEHTLEDHTRYCLGTYAFYQWVVAEK